MPEYPMTDSIITSLNAQEPWPDNVKLYQPYEVEQILLPDNASCLAVQAFLKMCNLPFEVEMRWNAEYMSPSGRVPFIKCGAFVVSELEPIVQFAANKGVSLCSRLGTEEKAEMRAYMSLITNVLVNAELYISWLDEATFNAVTRIRHSSVYPWPLGWLQTRAKRAAVAKRLRALDWHQKTLDHVLADVEQCCNSLSQRLGDKDFFFGTAPTPLDALVYGHIRALLSATGPKAGLMIRPITSALLRHLLRVANLADMKLTPQEEYLVMQAFQVTKRRLSPDRERRRSRPALRVPSRDSLTYGKDMFGFKPFASKQIIIMTSKEGNITCEVNGKHAKTPYDREQANFIAEILEDVLDKVDEIAYTGTLDAERNDFEVIAFNNQDIESKDSGYAIDIKLEDLVHAIGQDDEEVIDMDEVIPLEFLDSHNDSHATNDEELLDISADEIPLEGQEVGVKETDVAADLNKTLSSLLTDSRPTELDALVFGHVFTIITTRLPCRRLADTVRKHEALVALAKRVDEQYFKRT